MCEKNKSCYVILETHVVKSNQLRRPQNGGSKIFLWLKYVLHIKLLNLSSPWKPHIEKSLKFNTQIIFKSKAINDFIIVNLYVFIFEGNQQLHDTPEHLKNVYN